MAIWVCAPCHGTELSLRTRTMRTSLPPSRRTILARWLLNACAMATNQPTAIPLTRTMHSLRVYCSPADSLNLFIVLRPLALLTGPPREQDAPPALHGES